MQRQRSGLGERSTHRASKSFCMVGMPSLWRCVVGNGAGKEGKAGLVILH